jgi:hypothetical protein
MSSVAHQNLKIGVLGSGIVGETLANGFLKHGYAVMRGSRDPAKLTSWHKGAGPKAAVGNFAETARYGDIVVLAVKGAVVEAALDEAGIANLRGKTVIDPTNPIAEVAPVHGVLQFFTKMNESLLERLQAKAPEARFVKAFSCVSSYHMVDPQFKERPSMFICGNDGPAKEQVREVLTRFGWDTEDMGRAEAARAIEPLCMLYCIPGLTRHEWNHAYHVLRR